MDVVVGFVGGFLLMYLVNGIDLIPWRRSVGQHWTERARILWPVRRTASLMLFLAPALLIFAVLWLEPRRDFNVEAFWLPAFLGGILATWFLSRELFPGCSFRTWFMEFLLGFGLRLGFVLVVIMVVILMPDRLGTGTWWTLAGVAILFFLWSPLMLRVLRLLGAIKPAGERLRGIVASCQDKQNVRVTNVWEAVGESANAFALPRTGELIFMSRMVSDYTDEEIAAICSHELGHLAEPTKVIVGRYLGSMAFLPFLMVRPVMDRWGMEGLLVLFGIVIVWARLARRLANRMEHRADSAAHANESGEGVYARVLEKIYEMNQIPAVTHGSSQVHPHLYDRMVAAGVTPSFPRPKAPARFTVLGWLMLLACVGMVFWSNTKAAPSEVPRTHRKTSGQTGVSLPKRPRSDPPSRPAPSPIPSGSDVH